MVFCEGFDQSCEGLDFMVFCFTLLALIFFHNYLCFK